MTQNFKSDHFCFEQDRWTGNKVFWTCRKLVHLFLCSELFLKIGQIDRETSLYKTDHCTVCAIRHLVIIYLCLYIGRK